MWHHMGSGDAEKLTVIDDKCCNHMCLVKSSHVFLEITTTEDMS